ncbi:hypothetical protein [Streptomyces sp. NPDC058757]|uniref:hypothetical protein n=1 Tax=Streptomyces sp. NPDC058757 TaxID=3346626 RepID=UPI00368CE964
MLAEELEQLGNGRSHEPIAVVQGDAGGLLPVARQESNAAGSDALPFHGLVRADAAEVDRVVSGPFA